MCRLPLRILSTVVRSPAVNPRCSNSRNWAVAPSMCLLRRQAVSVIANRLERVGIVLCGECLRTAESSRVSFGVPLEVLDQLVDGGVDMDTDRVCGRVDDALGNVDAVVEPCVTLVFGCERANEVLFTAALICEDGDAGQAEQNFGTVIRDDQAAHVGEHSAVAATPRLVRPDARTDEAV